MIIKRDLCLQLKNHLDKKEISLIIGPRQVGKTTLMLLLEESLKKKGERTLFLNLDRERDKEYFVSQEELIHKIQLELGNQRGYVFIDEIQRKENAGIFLKGIFDSNLPYKFIVSGSGSLELKEKIHESLVGRKKVFQLDPVSFLEFVNFKTNYRYQDRLKDFFKIEKEKTDSSLRDYLNFGGYPRVILADRIDERREIIDDIFHSYLEKDITYLLGVEKREAFSHLIKILASQTGELVNYSKLSAQLNISLPTLKNYLWYIEKTFVIKKVTPYFRNIKKEIVKSPVYYFYDLGLRNYSLGLFGYLNDFGLVFENFIFNIFKEKVLLTGIGIHFWRSKEKAEVDFVFSLGDKILPCEIKYKKMTKPEITRSLRSFISKYCPGKALIVNLTLKSEIKVDQTTVFFVPFWELFSYDLAEFIINE